ncbi:hypothetical protein Pmani_032042 [Petrolisthes manimaculis]|uniref:Uncharacterized protein n=1 Tax=Petrolisthes manimaculis TaxID=1843537 RepID=A0AAE1NTU7_9EUCA|nr:hypothetical protein Pmani_032042 [Petrolisthes manimaculis]
MMEESGSQPHHHHQYPQSFRHSYGAQEQRRASQASLSVTYGSPTSQPLIGQGQASQTQSFVSQAQINTMLTSHSCDSQTSLTTSHPLRSSQGSIDVSQVSCASSGPPVPPQPPTQPTQAPPAQTPTSHICADFPF